MRKSFTFWLFTAFAAVMLGSCNEQASIDPPVLEIESMTDVSLASSAGEFEIVYNVTNPVEGGKVTAEFTADWLAESGHEDGIFTFSCSENVETEARSASINIKYTWPDGADEKEVKVVQAGVEEIPADYEMNATYFYGEYYGDEDEDGRFNYKVCLSVSPIDQAPVAGNYYFLDIYGQEAMDMLNPCPQEGEYMVDAWGNDENGIVAKDNSYVLTVAEDGTSEELKLQDGVLSIYTDGEDEVYELLATDKNGKVHKVVFSGFVMYKNLEPKSDIIEEDFVLDAKFAKASTEMPFQGFVNVDMAFSDKEFPAESEAMAGCSVLNIEAIFPYDRDGNIPEGTYPIESTLALNTLLSGYVNEKDPARTCYGTFAEVFDETGHRSYGLAVSGTMEVSGDKDNYDIVCKFETPEGIKIDVNYSGALEIEGLPDAFSTLTEDYVLDLESASGTAIFREGGNWAVLLNSVDGMNGGDNFEISFVTDGQSAEEGMATGTYKAAESGVPQKGEYLPGYDLLGQAGGTFFYNGFDFETLTYITVAPAVEGDFNITNLGNNEYSISFSFLDDLGFTWSGEWTGTMEIRDYSE